MFLPVLACFRHYITHVVQPWSATIFQAQHPLSSLGSLYVIYSSSLYSSRSKNEGSSLTLGLPVVPSEVR